ncbi:polyphosphate kinase 1 [Desulfobacter postgatei]|uniref:Polyphosphate kinase n=1 Tax=Desulfobacter postgatei 2ac9 TaxID=879212 RepID=I5B465_9BACT|nr:polyphosphate kinase 1 [Desulfobacter postgatei]EIM64278.1 polyphosphate kinase 1 [Desulfobacter postgatei 2ac9]
MSFDEQNNAIEREPISAKQQLSTQFDLDSSEWFLNRELTWLEFNRRVLHEGQDSRTPLLERVFFLSVVGSNLDEFFMKRIGGLKQLVGAGVKKLSVDGRTPQEQIYDCHIVVQDILKQNQMLEKELKTRLAEAGIVLMGYDQLTKEQKTFANNFFSDNVYPLLTPQGMDPAHPFPFISNLSLNLLVKVSYPNTEHAYLNRIKVPVDSGVSSRFIKIGEEDLYVPIEDVIANNLDLLFPGMVIESCDFFRVTRNAITERDQEQANDLLSMIESALRDRKFAEIVRLEVNPDMSMPLRGLLAAELNINEEKDVFEVEGIIAKRHLMQIAELDRQDLRFPPHQPVDHPELAGDDPNIFHIIKQRGSILLQHPYESFDTSVERFIKEASRDPKVLAIKMTLYRTAKQSRVMQYLIDAAQNGKQVAVVVELKARFDESANILWARSLEEVGIHVTYGVVDLKTHSKVIFVVRKDFDGLHRYAHIGTGNYHAGTARGYSDLGLLTCDAVIGSDLTELFNYLTTGYTLARKYKKLLPCPNFLKKKLLEKIDRESKLQAEGKAGLIQLKTNALEDKEITIALYKASQAGVHIDLIVRDSCRLRPGIPGLSENVRVISIVGRFLEHSRVFYFRNDGKEEYFISSADLMKRNLESRVEVCTPVESPRLQALLREMLDIQLNDRHSCWEMQSDGSYVQLQAQQGEDARSSFELLIKNAEKRLKTTHRMLLKKGKAASKKKK